MVARLAPAPLERARDPLSRLLVRDWILQGRQTLDGLVCVKAWKSEGWAQALLPWLDRAEELRESADYLHLRFATPVEVDCASLGVLLPLRLQRGILSSARLDIPDQTVGEAVKGHLVLVLAGEPRLVPLAAFRRLDVAGLWDYAVATTMAAAPIPRLQLDGRPTKLLKTQPAVPFDPADAMAGFAELQKKLEVQRPPGFWERLGGRFPNLGRRLNLAARIIVGAGLIGSLTMFLRQFPAMGAGPGAVTGLVEAAPRVFPSLLEALSGFFGSTFAHLGGLLGLLALSGTLLGRRAGTVGKGVAKSGSTAAAAPAKPRKAGWWRRLTARLWGRRDTAPAPSQAGASGGQGQAPAKPKERGLLGRLTAWLVWNTPLRKDIQRQYAQRLREVERLFAEGRIEEALRKALALSNEHDPDAFRKLLQDYADIALSGPVIRQNLDLDLSGTTKKSSGGMGEDAYAHFTRLYREQAQALVAAGEVESAVFIYAELLNDVRGAVDLLIRNNRLETAARLAQARRLPPGFFIPLWYRAGNKKRALALAARHEAFQELWKELKPDDPFRAEIGIEWARRLVASGHFDRALDISDGLDGIEAERRQWIVGANQGPLRGEALARALKVLPWAMEDGALYGVFSSVLKAGPALASERVALARALADATIEKGAEKANFAARLPLLAHHLARRLAADEAELGHDKERAEAAGALAERGRQFALRVDLRRLAKVPKPSQAEPQNAFSLPPTPPLAWIIDAVVVPGGRVLVAYKSGLLKLLSFSGKEIWRDQVNGLDGLIAVGAGHSVLLVRDDLGERHLSVLETATQCHRELGPFPVSFYHPWASEAGWLVFSGGQVLYLDIPALLSPEGPAGEEGLVQHWAIRMGEPGQPLFFLDKPGDVNFAYQRYDGLIEWWWLDKKTLRITCRFWTNPPRQDEGGEKVISVFGNAAADTNAAIWLWLPGTPRAVSRVDASRDEEIAMIQAQPLDQARLVALEPMASLTSIRWRVSAHDRGADWSSWHPETGRSYHIVFEGAERAWARPHLHEPVITVFDDLGRLMVVDVKESRLLMKLA